MSEYFPQILANEEKATHCHYHYYDCCYEEEDSIIIIIINGRI